jgi:MobA/MobL family
MQSLRDCRAAGGAAPCTPPRTERDGKGSTVATYHLSCKAIGRSAGRSATGAAAYRAAERIHDARTGETHDYRRKRGVEHRELVLPSNAPAWARKREPLWNAAESAERRKNSTVAREFEIALPMELSAAQRRALAVGFANELVRRHGFAADVAIHLPHRSGDTRNHHAHILCSTRRLTPAGFADKTRELDDQRSGEIARWRERWAELQNEYLRSHGHEARVDHRTLEAQGLEREPTHHKGPAVTAMERRGLRTEVGERLTFEQERAITARLERAAELARIERERAELTRSILDLSGDLAAAKRERNSTLARAPARSLEERQKEGRERWLAMRAERMAKENAPEQGRSIDELARQAAERWLEYRREQELGKGREPGQSREREGPEKDLERGTELDGPEFE